MSNSMHMHNTPSKLLKTRLLELMLELAPFICNACVTSTTETLVHPFKYSRCLTAPSLNEMILNAALALLFYVCGYEFLFQSCSVGNPQYAPEVWHQTPGTPYIFPLRMSNISMKPDTRQSCWYLGYGKCALADRHTCFGIRSIWKRQ
jgi:hypothetical protein